jgi:hypothetical protein
VKIIFLEHAPDNGWGDQIGFGRDDDNWVLERAII